jgi:hypothetical protein
MLIGYLAASHLVFGADRSAQTINKTHDVLSVCFFFSLTISSTDRSTRSYVYSVEYYKQEFVPNEKNKYCGTGVHVSVALANVIYYLFIYLLKSMSSTRIIKTR